MRREQWAAFVRRQLAHVHVTRGWSVPKVAEAAGIGSNTIYRWRDGRGVRAPLPEQVVAFCDAVGVPASQAFAILWPGKHDGGRATAPQPLDDPDVVAIARKLADPNLPEVERYHLRETLRMLAARPVQPPDARPVRRRRAG